jgi:3-oxoacyl-[acyl-carrier protein] reductase
VAADEVVAAARAAGHKVAAEQVDVRDAAACAAAAERLVERCGRIDILVNNAGTIRDNPLIAFDDADVDTVVDTNVKGVFNITRAVAPHMVSKRSGRIVNISSVSADKGGRGQTNYAASKGAINAFTRALAVELAPRRITVNAVAPGVIETEMSQDVRELAGDEITSRILLRRYGKPEEIAYAVWFLVSAYANYVTGQVFSIDGGFKME